MARIASVVTAAFVAASTAFIGAGAEDPADKKSAGTAVLAHDTQAGDRERVIYTSVVDKNGEPVTGLGPDEFIVREDGVRREVLRVTPATDPIAIALLVDNSQAAEDDIRNIRDGLTAFVERMHKEHEIAVITIGDRPTIVQDYTRNAELLKQGIGRLFAVPGSGMTLLDALVETSRGLERRDEPRAAIIPIITDGTEFTNRHADAVVDALKRGGAAMHAVTIGTFPTSMADPIRNRARVLDEGPRATGGQRVTLLTSMAVDGALEKLARELSNQHKVVYGRPESLLQPETVTVAVTRPDHTARGTVERRKPGA
jgi:Ca-activated chloride channel family protein